MDMKKPTIAELEKLLNAEESKPIRILPDGSIKVGRKRKSEKVITMREDLGGEYGRYKNRIRAIR